MTVMTARRRELTFRVGERTGEVSALLDLPEPARHLLVLGHGAGAGMEHPFLEAIAHRLAARGVATFRYRFPYTEAGRRRPDPQPVLVATVRAAVAAAAREAPGLPLAAGGKSMGGRMTSLAAAGRDGGDGPGLAEARALVFLGFPLHAPGRPGTERADHLDRVRQPMLFLQGTRDRLAGLDLIEPVIERLGDRATLHVVDGGDHSFRVPKRSGRSDEEVLDDLAETTARWLDRL